MCAQSLTHLTQNFQDCINGTKDSDKDGLKSYCTRIGDTRYQYKLFFWFRPAAVNNHSDRKQTHTPFNQKEIEELAEKIENKADYQHGNSGDWAMMQLQSDTITAVNRAYSLRHRPKLQHYANAAAIHRIHADVLQKTLIEKVETIKQKAG